MVTSSRELGDAIERCYAAFAGEPRPRKLDSSPLRDADGILRALSSAPLRELGGEHIGPYSRYAITTVGDGRDYRHFLPRILELAILDPVWPGAEPPVIASKLQCADWHEWPEDQQGAVRAFFLAAFDAAIEQHPDEGVQSAELWLCTLILLGEPPSSLVEQWRASPSPNAALQMASFIAGEARQLRRHGKVGSSFWEDVEPDKRGEVARLLLAPETRAFIEAAADRVAEEDRFFLIEAALGQLQRQF